MDSQPGVPREHRKLLDGRGTPHVGGDQKRMPALAGQPTPQLGGRRGLARTLQSDQQHYLRPGGGGREPRAGLAEELQQFVANDGDDLLGRGEAVEHRPFGGPIANPIDEGLDDLEVDVRLEQRQPDLPQRTLDRLRRQPHLAAQRPEHILQA